MTTIVGVVRDGTAAIAADSLSVDDERMFTDTEKSFQLGGVTVAISGDYRAIQYMRHFELDPAPYSRFYMEVTFPRLVREYFYSLNYHGDWSMMVAWPGPHLYVVNSEGESWAIDSHDAIGSGAAYALGAMEIATRHGSNAAELAADAVSVASRLHLGTGGYIAVREVS